MSLDETPAANSDLPSARDMSCVTHLQYEGRDLYVVGTAHVSQRSVEEVSRLIEELRPDTVCIELDKTRLESMKDPKRWRSLDIFQVIRERKILFLLTSLALSGYQRRLGEKLGVRPGAEMLAAIEKADEVGAELVLVDRDIQATLKRTWGALTLWDRFQLVASLGGAVFAKDEISAEQVEALKDRDNIGSMIQQFAEAMPRLQIPLIDERDRFLISSAREAPGKTIVVVVGAGHVGGMERYLQTPVDREELSKIPTPTLLMRSLKWVLPLIVLSAFYKGWVDHESEGLIDMLLAWVIPNSVLAALLSIVAGARPLTVLAALVASPITSLNPTIGAGMVAAYVEALQRRPTVADCEALNEVSSLRDWYGNRFTRVLLVGLAATLGSSLGAWVGAAWVVLFV